MRPTGLLWFVLLLSAGTGLSACAQDSSGRSSDRGSATSHSVWPDATEDEALLYGQAVRAGLEGHPDIQKMMVTVLLHEQVYSQLAPDAISEEDLKAFFEEERPTFTTPARIHLRRILLRPTEELSGPSLEARAGELHRDVLANTDGFAGMARDYSQGPYALEGGDIGFITTEGKGGLDSEAVTHAFAMKPGGSPELVHTAEGWNILWVPAIRDRIEPTYEEVRHTALRRLRARKHRALQDEYLSKLRAAGERP